MSVGFGSSCPEPFIPALLIAGSDFLISVAVVEVIGPENMALALE